MGGEGVKVVPAAGLLGAPENLIESTWRTLKGFLLPRRFYDSVGELKQAVLHALSLLGAVEVQCSLGGT